MTNEPVLLSNEFDDFQAGGGLYPGGEVQVTSAAYKLWDYEGTQPPDSMVCVALGLKPLDGSNDGKEFIQNWNVGESKHFLPSGAPDEGKFLFGTGRAAANLSSNWGVFGESLKKNCGMQKGYLNQAHVGIAALVGSRLTLVRQDQPDREGFAPTPVAPGQQAKPARKRTILIATRAVFPWDKGGARPAASPAPAAVGAPAPMASPSPAPTAAHAATNGASNGDWKSLLPAALEELLADAPNNAIAIGDLLKPLTDKVLSGQTSKVRMEGLKTLKAGDLIREVAAAQGWNFDGTTLSA